MRFVLFYHSLISDWNHATAHVLRGVASELLARGDSVRILEPVEGWSLHNLREQGGDGVVKAFYATYPRLRSSFYDPATINLDDELADADVVIAHEWNDAAFLHRLGEHRAQTRSYRLLFHDAPHRSLQQPLQMRAQVLSRYDGVLASSEGLRRMYQEHGWAANAWTWREAVDTRIFRAPATDLARSLDMIWIGNWGNGERASELDEFLIEPIRSLGLRARFYGSRYPQEALHILRTSGVDYGGWIPDFCIPAALAAARFTINVPRRMRNDGLPHTPAIRVLQALACGIPVVTAPWDECEELFAPGVDLLVGHNGPEVERHLVELLEDPEFARLIAANGHQTVLSRHTCSHRVQELLAICRELGVGDTPKTDQAHTSGLGAERRPQPPKRSSVPAAWN
jgi:spore maturation protein CgeB